MIESHGTNSSKASPLRWGRTGCTRRGSAVPRKSLPLLPLLMWLLQLLPLRLLWPRARLGLIEAWVGLRGGACVACSTAVGARALRWPKGVAARVPAEANVSTAASTSASAVPFVPVAVATKLATSRRHHHLLHLRHLPLHPFLRRCH